MKVHKHHRFDAGLVIDTFADFGTDIFLNRAFPTVEFDCLFGNRFQHIGADFFSQFRPSFLIQNIYRRYVQILGLPVFIQNRGYKDAAVISDAFAVFDQLRID